MTVFVGTCQDQWDCTAASLTSVTVTHQTLTSWLDLYPIANKKHYWNHDLLSTIQFQLYGWHQTIRLQKLIQILGLAMEVDQY